MFICNLCKTDLPTIEKALWTECGLVDVDQVNVVDVFPENLVTVEDDLLAEGKVYNLVPYNYRIVSQCTSIFGRQQFLYASHK